jgi:hypothetical protein
MNSSHMPPVPPANRSRKGRGSDPEMSKDTSVKQPEHHHNAAEEGETANIKQNTTNKGFFRGRRLGRLRAETASAPAAGAARGKSRPARSRSSPPSGSGFRLSLIGLWIGRTGGN